ncbi:hypothetical protein J2Z21_003436 [Streptomyces griseochromogenes]|uniref:Uncharacterized protein n=1 Tax=Streptomyces griseochromogenes TaxID=68214 RepID=A0A1B1B8A9_9ACTN|nr:hypothetical protein [Streptomyces griseochromogenes]ANP55084.1 hypothetical protein AVL59_40780 [Streptomyces griseochromogenes]MBP2050497.1 hypothetical protein [Streptomyces griseochromogenes]
MTAGHEGAADAGRGEGAAEYGGMDALMAAITGEPLPEEAGEDTAFLAEHRSAEADVAVLRERLSWLAEALTGEVLPENEAGGPEAEEREAAGQRAAGRDADGASAAREASAAAGKPATGNSGGTRETGGTGGAGAARGTGGTGGAGAGAPRPRGVTRPVGPARPARPPRPGRPSGPRRALRIALGSLAAGAAFAMVAGFGWVVTHSAGGGLMSGGSADSADSAAKGSRDAPAEAYGDGGRPTDPARVLACYRLVVEGTVAEVEPQPAHPRTRIVLRVSRSYKPAHTPAEVSFLLDGGAQPAPRKGQHVLVGVGQGRDNAGLWAVGDSRVAADRAWITEALPESRRATCPSEEEPTGTP